MTGGRKIAAGVVCVAALVVAAPSPAFAGGGETQRTKHVTAGGTFTHTHWTAVTTARSAKGSQDSARVCKDGGLPLHANLRIYATDKDGATLRVLSVDDAKFGCRTLTAPKATTHFRFRLNVSGDGAGEETWTMRSTRK